MAARRLVAWEGVTVVVAAALVFLVCFTWEERQSALPPSPTVQPHRRPPPRGSPELFPPPRPLLDLPAVSFVANAACVTEPLLLVILVISHPANVAFRHAHRTHIPWESLDAMGARRVFVVADGSIAGQPEYPWVGRGAVLEEAARHRDLVVADFQEHYRNLTYKHTLALTWAITFCAAATFILKMDDDIMVDVWGVAAFLRAAPAVDRLGEVRTGADGRLLSGDEAWAAGLVQSGLLPQRSSGKWRVTHAEYPGQVYPDFLAGWAYLATQPAANAMLKAAPTMPPFWIDDVHITGTVAAVAGVPRYSLGRHYSLMAGPATCCLRGPRSGSTAPHPTLAPMCDLLVAPSNKNVTLMQEWLGAARACHEGGVCPVHSPTACRAVLRPLRGVGTVIPLT